MKIPFNEIWSFLRLFDGEEHKWRLCLKAGRCSWEADFRSVAKIEKDITYDPELLPNLFTFREIFWQPNVYPSLNACLTGLKLLSNLSEEIKTAYGTTDKEPLSLYVVLVAHIGKLASEAHETLGESGEAAEKLAAVLGEFRKQSFPVIMLFIHHPMNKPSYREDALRRINFMVKTLLEQYQLRFNDLLMPYWEIERITQEDDASTQKVADQAEKSAKLSPEAATPSAETGEPS